MTDRVSVAIDDGIADVRLNRPEKMNALDARMFEAISAVGRDLSTDRGLRVVVLSGEGRAFCAGLDFGNFQAMADATRERPAHDLMAREPGSPANYAQRAGYIWTELPVPVIAAMHGVAFGGGLQLALGADIRFAALDCRLSIMEIKWGLVPDMGGTQLLRHLLPLDIIKELTYTGRIVTGTQARELGLVTHIDERPHEAAMELAREIAAKSPDAVRSAKKLLNASVNASLEEGLLMESRLQLELIGTPNQVEAVASNLENRPADYQDPE